MGRLAVPSVFFKGALVYICLSMILAASCSRGTAAYGDEERIEFLKGYGIDVDTRRPYYSSNIIIPKVFSATWEIRSAFTKDMLNIELSKFSGKQCGIFMYPVSKLPPDIRKISSSEARAVIINYKDRIICAYIEFISETRGISPVSLKGRTIGDITGVKWSKWKDDMEDDDNKKLVIWQYYDALKSKKYEEAYEYIFDKKNITREQFIKVAGSISLPDMDFLNLEQDSETSDMQCSFTARTNVKKGKGSSAYEIRFQLKKDPSSNVYGGWKIENTSIK